LNNDFIGKCWGKSIDFSEHSLEIIRSTTYGNKNHITLPHS